MGILVFFLFSICLLTLVLLAFSLYGILFWLHIYLKAGWLTGINNRWAAHLLNKFNQSSSWASGNLIFCNSKSICPSTIVFHFVSVSWKCGLDISSVNITKCTGVLVKSKTDFITLRDSLNLVSQTTKDITILSMYSFSGFLEDL